MRSVTSYCHTLRLMKSPQSSPFSNVNVIVTLFAQWFSVDKKSVASNLQFFYSHVSFAAIASGCSSTIQRLLVLTHCQLLTECDRRTDRQIAISSTKRTVTRNWIIACMCLCLTEVCASRRWDGELIRQKQLDYLPSYTSSISDLQCPRKEDYRKLPI